MRKTPVVGQTLYSLYVGNAPIKQKLAPVIVTKVGRKYFSTMEEGKPYTEAQFHIDGWRQKTEYSATRRLYESEQEYDEEREMIDLWEKLCDFFNYRNRTKLTLQKLREIYKIVGDA